MGYRTRALKSKPAGGTSEFAIIEYIEGIDASRMESCRFLPNYSQSSQVKYPDAYRPHRLTPGHAWLRHAHPSSNCRVRVSHLATSLESPGMGYRTPMRHSAHRKRDTLLTTFSSHLPAHLHGGRIFG